MDYLNSMVNVTSHLIFIGIVYYLLTGLFDWSKIIKMTADNISRLKLLLLLFSIAIGYLVSSFLLSVLRLSQEILFAV